MPGAHRHCACSHTPEVITNLVISGGLAQWSPGLNKSIEVHCQPSLTRRGRTLVVRKRDWHEIRKEVKSKSVWVFFGAIKNAVEKKDE